MEVFPYLPFVPDKKTVMRRLGSQKAAFPAELDNVIDSYLRQAASAFAARGKAAVYPLEHIDDAHIRIEGIIIESPMLVRLLSSSGSVYLMGASIPERDVAKIGQGLWTVRWM
jgi:hypothetical protein